MLTKEQRELRRGLIGASDAPAIVGVDPYKSAADVWAVHRGLVTVEENDAMRRGNVLEPALLNYIESEFGEITRDVMLIHSDGIRCANLDGLDKSGGVFDEVKTSRIRKGWGDEGSDDHWKVVRVLSHGCGCCSSDNTEPTGWMPLPTLPKASQP